MVNRNDRWNRAENCQGRSFAARNPHAPARRRRIFGETLPGREQSSYATECAARFERAFPSRATRKRSRGWDRRDRAQRSLWAELKRMWVVPEARRLGVSKIILTALEVHARSEGVGTLRLETGVQNHAALDLYTRAGFKRCNPFGDYRADPLSVFMQLGVAGPALDFVG